jgi:septum site-determining protein MinC
MQPTVQIKGIREGLLIILGEGAWDEVRAALLQQLDQQAEFLRGARLALDVGNHILKAVDLGQLRDQLSDRGLSLWAVLSNSPTTERTAQAFGLATRLNKPRPERSTRPLETTLHGGEGASVAGPIVRQLLNSYFELKSIDKAAETP